MDVYEEMVATCAALGVAGIPYALVGGLAVSMYLPPRATLDIDLLVLEEDLPAISDALKPLGYFEYGKLLNLETVRIRRLAKVLGGDFLVLDLLFADEASAPAIAHAEQMKSGLSIIKVAPIRGIIELKRRRMSPIDRADIAMLEERLGQA